MNWKPEWTIALVPIAVAMVVSIVLVAAGSSSATAQWGAIIAFLVLVPFCIGRLLDRER